MHPLIGYEDATTTHNTTRRSPIHFRSWARLGDAMAKAGPHHEMRPRAQGARPARRPQAECGGVVLDAEDPTAPVSSRMSMTPMVWLGTATVTASTRWRRLPTCPLPWHDRTSRWRTRCGLRCPAPLLSCVRDPVAGLDLDGDLAGLAPDQDVVLAEHGPVLRDLTELLAERSGPVRGRRHARWTDLRIAHA